MSESKEFQNLPEIKTINPDLKQLLNGALEVCYDNFLEKNKDKSQEPDVMQFLDNLATLEKSLDEKEGSIFALRGEFKDDNGILHINLSLKENIDFNKKLPNGSFKINVNPNSNATKEAEISIQPFFEYKGHSPDPAKTMSQTGYAIDFSVREVSLVKNDFNPSLKLKFSNKQAGLGIRIYDDGKCFTFLKSYIGNEDFSASRKSLKNSEKTPTNNVSKHLQLILPNNYLKQFS